MIKTFLQILKEIQSVEFNWATPPDHIKASMSGHKHYWRIGLRVKHDDTDSVPYVFISYELKLKLREDSIGWVEYDIQHDSIAYEEGAVVKTFDYAKKKFKESVITVFESL
jgi:hypothetical protein